MDLGFVDFLLQLPSYLETQLHTTTVIISFYSLLRQNT